MSLKPSALASASSNAGMSTSAIQPLSLMSFILINAQTKFKHSVNPIAKGVWSLKAESESKQSSLEQQQNQILYRLVILVSISPLPKLFQQKRDWEFFKSGCPSLLNR
ncbi:unnamed protein product [Fraxinus pennsylvanica]|uniref:Uncharacterized protein n=1 Tax=Fraxinus pennsylvanica TaxID=56036 RepID=A0AAD1ZNG4_9LAMI|nr:unnamed protein product [Fraxinus pennsylvanica]